MGYVQDLRESIERGGGRGSGLTRNEQLMLANSQAFGVFNREDLQWAGQFAETQAIHNYFDYFFTGQDIQVYMDGIDKPDPEAELPIHSLQFSVEQQKKPVYGFWSYTHDAVMRGTRVVAGSMILHTLSTDYMQRQLSKAATARKNKNTKFVMRGLDKDERNIEQYWGRNINDDSAYSGGKHIFSAHPPFNLVIVYGIQSSTITENLGGHYREVVNGYRSSDTPLHTDINERLVETETGNSMRIILENCEITGFTTQYAADGSPVMERYDFFARDVRTPKLGASAGGRIIPEARV